MPSGQEIALSQGRFFIPDLRPDPQQGEITFKANGDTPTVLELLDHEPLGYIQSVGLKPDFLGGTADGGFTLTMPLLANLEFDQIKVRGAAHLNDAIATNLVGPFDVSGGTLDVNLTEQSVEANGEISIKGVPAELAWQRIFRTPDDQPAADPGDGPPRCAGAREARHQGQPSGAWTDAHHVADRAARRRRRRRS